MQLRRLMFIIGAPPYQIIALLLLESLHGKLEISWRSVKGGLNVFNLEFKITEVKYFNWILLCRLNKVILVG